MWTDSGQVAVPGGRIAWVARGDGAPVVLLHKLGGWAEEWQAVAALLPGRVIAIDLPGHGNSRSFEPAGWTMPVPDQAALLGAAIDGLGLTRPVLVGNSLGGVLALWLAAENPDRARALVLSSTSFSTPMAPAEAERFDTEFGHRYGADGLPIPLTADQMVHLYGRHDATLFADHNASRARAGRWTRWGERAVMVADLAACLPKLTMPVALIFGERDPYIPKYEAMALATVPHATSTCIRDAGRFPHEEQPAAFAAAVLATLARAN